MAYEDTPLLVQLQCVSGEARYTLPMGDSTFGDALDEIPAPTGGIPEPDGACPDCEGRGWVVEEDGGAGTARPCHCQTVGRAQRLLAAAGIPERYRSCRLHKFEVSEEDPGARRQLQEALALSRRYIEYFLQPGGSFTESGLLYIGPPGVGKTHLAVAVLRELIETYGVQGRFVDFTSLIHQIQSTFDPESSESKRQVLGPVMNTQLLVLDELGAQKPTDWVQNVLYLVINNRYVRRLPTLFTTNYRLEEAQEPPRIRENLDRGKDPHPRPSDRFVSLGNRIPPALASRLHEMARPIQMTAVNDFRSDIGRHRHEL